MSYFTKEIELPKRIEAVLAADGLTASIEMKADVGGDFELELVDEHGLRNPKEPVRTLNVIFDMPPELTVSGVHESDEFRPDDLIPVNCSVADDLGIGTLELHYRLNGNVTKIIPASTLVPGATVAQEAFRRRFVRRHDAVGMVRSELVDVRHRRVE